MNTYERSVHAWRVDLDARIGRLHAAIKSLRDPDGLKAREYRRNIAFYSDLLAVVRRHERPTMPIAKLTDVRAA